MYVLVPCVENNIADKEESNAKEDELLSNDVEHIFENHPNKYLSLFCSAVADRCTSLRG